MEAVKAMVVGGWKPTHLGSFTASRWGWGCPETQAPLTLPLLHLRGGGAGESPPQIVIVPGPAQAQVPLQPQQLAANPGDTGSCGRGGAARHLASISRGAGSAQCH